jgi:hypothetical protein
MKPNEIRVGRLQIRLKGADAKSARALGSSIGAEVLAQIAQQVDVGDQARAIKIAQLDAGTLQLGARSHAPGTGEAIAKKIGAIVKSKISSGGKGLR